MPYTWEQIEHQAEMLGFFNEPRYTEEDYARMGRSIELQDKIDNHDCHKSEDSGCPCDDWKRELTQLKTNA